MTGETILEIWVVYARPSDFPDAPFVLRRQWAMKDGTIRADKSCALANTLEAIRELVPPGKVLLARSPDDDPVIVETWV